MALTESEIRINGKLISPYISFSLEQEIFEHHRFRLVCPAESLDGKISHVFNQSKEVIGATIRVETKLYGGEAKLIFEGLVTQVENARYSGNAGNLVIMGYSPTILLDSGPHCKSWEKKALKNIAQDCVNLFPQNLLNPKISPINSETLSYVVQYKETIWQFLNRLSSTFGEWFYYSGKSLIMGSPAGKTVQLIYGNNLTNFTTSIELRPGNFQALAYDYINTQVYNATPTGIEGKAGLDDIGKYALKTSKDLFKWQSKLWNNYFLTNKKQLDDNTNVRASAQSANMIRCNGSSEHPEVQLGNTIEIKGNDNKEKLGQFIVISVTHQTDGQGNYTNEFTAIPASLKIPPIIAYAEPHAETQSAVVTDNNDPKGLGRIRVQFHWMEKEEKTPWLRMTSQHSGNGKGVFFIPEKGEEVIVGFEGDSPVKPYVIGTVYNSKNKTEFSNAENDIKTIQTRSGNKIVMNDKEGSVYLEDKDGNQMKFDGKGKIDVKANESITLTCGESKIEMKKDGTINITGKEITVNAKKKAKMGSGQSSFTADGDAGEAKMEGTKAKVTGQSEVKVSGANTDISGSAKVAVKAAMITLN